MKSHPLDKACRRPLVALSILSSLGMGLVACDDLQPSVEPAGETGLTIAVAPLTLTGIGDACYDLRVTNGPDGTGDTVVSRGVVGLSRFDGDTETICSSRFGNEAGGDLAYVAPCDASTGMNSVTIWVDGLYTGVAPTAQDLGDWQDPCPAGCTLNAECVENADRPVNFNFNIMRAASQGFFDVAVNFENIFCSAKLDCVDAFLHYPAGHPQAGQRGPTAIVAFACTAGEGESTWLHLNYIRVRCEGSPESWVYIDPTVPEGNTGVSVPPVFQAGVYYGREGFQDLDKCYWNTAVGIDPEALASTCWLEVEGTASNEPFVAGQSPGDTSWPWFQWAVQLNSEPGVLDCGAHPVNGPGSQVQTSYTQPPVGMSFAHTMACGEELTFEERGCEGAVPGLTGGVRADMMPEGLVVFAGPLQSPPLALPPELDGYALVDGGCCVDPCCAD